MSILLYKVLIIQIILTYGVRTISVVIEKHKVGLLGENGTDIECLYSSENFIQFNVAFMAYNKNMSTFETITSYIPDSHPRFTNVGQYLKGRVTLTPITCSSTKAVMTFNKLMCIDDRFYQCQVSYLDSNGNHDPISNNISISVQVPPSKPDSISVVQMPADSSVTTTKHMNYSSSSLAKTPQENETVSSLQSVTMNNTTTLNYSSLPKIDYDTTSSIPLNNDFSSDIMYRSTTYSTQQTTTAQGIVEGDNITVVCTGDVGKPPTKYFFQKYLNGKVVHMKDTVTSTSISEMSENCSYYRTSNLTFQVTAKDNNAVIRCVVNSSMAEPDMFIETAPIEVYSDKSTPSTAGSAGYKTKGIWIAFVIAIIAVLIVIGFVIVLYRRGQKENYKPVYKMWSNMDQIESQKTTRGVPPTNSTKKTTRYEDVDLDNTDMKFKLMSNEETIAKVKQHNDDYLKKQKEDEDKDNPTTPPEAAVYACVNKPKNTVTIENNTTAGQQEEDLYEESKEGIYDTSGDRRHKENITAENYNSTENLKKEESDHDEQKSQVGAYINKSFENDIGNKEEKRQVATVSPTVRLSFGYQGDGQTNNSNEIQPKNTNQPVKHKGQTGSTEKQRNQETSL